MDGGRSVLVTALALVVLLWIGMTVAFKIFPGRPVVFPAAQPTDANPR